MGSEMCIRDSFQEVRLKKTARPDVLPQIHHRPLTSHFPEHVKSEKTGLGEFAGYADEVMEEFGDSPRASVR